MFQKKKVHEGIDASGEYHVLPPTFGGIKSLVEKVGGNLDVAAAAFPEPNLPNDESVDIVQEFVNELEFCDKVERVHLVREFSDYVKSLREAPAGMGNGGPLDLKGVESSVALDSMDSPSPAAQEGADAVGGK